MSSDHSNNGRNNGHGESIPIELSVNGRRVSLDIPPQLTLLDLVRDRLSLKGAKRSCDLQVCGTCTILVNGKAVSACTYLAYEARGAEVLTIEGMADGEELHPLQRNCLELNGLQCGICTPGILVAAKALLERNPDPTEEEIRRDLSSNLCMCTGYVQIVAAVKQAAKRLRQ